VVVARVVAASPANTWRLVCPITELRRVEGGVSLQGIDASLTLAKHRPNGGLTPAKRWGNAGQTVG